MTMDLETLAKLAALAMGGIGVLKAGWALAAFLIGLRDDIRALTLSVQKMDRAVGTLLDKHDDHERRLTRLEARSES